MSLQSCISGQRRRFTHAKNLPWFIGTDISSTGQNMEFLGPRVCHLGISYEAAVFPVLGLTAYSFLPCGFVPLSTKSGPKSWISNHGTGDRGHECVAQKRVKSLGGRSPKTVTNFWATRAQPSMEKALPSVSMVRVDTASIFWLTLIHM